MAPTKRELAYPPLLTAVLISFRPLHIQHEPLKPTTGLAARGLPDLPMFMTVTGEYDVTSPDRSVEGAFFFQNVMTVYPTGESMGTAYDGQQVFTGTIQGKHGAVSMRTRGNHVHEVSAADWDFIPETATAELKGISGTGRFRFLCGAETDVMATTVEGEFEVEWK